MSEDHWFLLHFANGERRVVTVDREYDARSQLGMLLYDNPGWVVTHVETTQSTFDEIAKAGADYLALDDGRTGLRVHTAVVTSV